METVLVGWRLLGGRSTGRADGDYDAVDLALDLADGSVRALGFRSPESVEAGTGGWTAGHVPFSVDLDPTTVRYWSFDRILWLGPAAHPCVVWTNAVSWSEAGIETLLRSARSGALLAGPDARGLPLLSQVLAAGTGSPV